MATDLEADDVTEWWENVSYQELLALFGARIVVASCIVRQALSRRIASYVALGLPQLPPRVKASPIYPERLESEHGEEEKEEIERSHFSNAEKQTRETADLVRKNRMKGHEIAFGMEKYSHDKMEAFSKKQQEFFANHEVENGVVQDYSIRPTYYALTKEKRALGKTDFKLESFAMNHERRDNLNTDSKHMKESDFGDDEMITRIPSDDVLAELDCIEDTDAETSSMSQICGELGYDEKLEEQHPFEQFQNKVGRPSSETNGFDLLASKTLQIEREFRDHDYSYFTNPIMWPFGLASKALGFQVWLVMQMFFLAASVFSWCNSFAVKRIWDTLQVKNKATEAMSMVSHVPPMVKESGGIVLKRATWGLLSAAYVCILLGILLLPAILLDSILVSRIVEEPLRITKPLHLDYTQAHPSSTISLSSGRSDGILSRKESPRTIPVGHKVHITVILTLPESDYNINLGMFQLTAELLSKDEEIIKKSSRPCMLRFYSPPVRMLKTFLMSLPLLVGILSESQTLTVPLMEFVEQSTPTSCFLRILLQPKSGVPLSHGLPELYVAEVHVESQLPFVRNILYKWKWTFYIWMGLVIYIFELILVFCFCRKMFVPGTWLQ